MPTAARASASRLDPPTKLELAARVAAALLGSYAFGWGFIALSTALGTTLMPFGEAQTLAHLLVFLVLVACFCWAFASRSIARVWGLLLGGGALMTLAAWLLTRGAP